MKTLCLLLFSYIVCDNGVFEVEVKTKEVKKQQEFSVNVSVYNPVVSQTDSTPLQTASMNIIDTNMLKAGKLKWVAISRDLKSRLKFGDTILLTGIGKLSGKYMVADLMNKRYKNKIDILSFSKKYCKSNGKFSCLNN